MEVQLYIPERIELEDLILKNPPKFKPFHKDNLIYILHLITSIPTENKRIMEEAKDGYTPIHKETLRQFVPNYAEHIEYLKLLEIVDVKRQYTVGQKSGGLRFTETYRGQRLKVVAISKTTLVNRIMMEEQKRKKIADDEYPYLTKWFETAQLEIDLEEAEECLIRIYKKDLKEMPVENADFRFKRNYSNVLRLANGDYRYGVDGTAKRFHTNLTNIKKELRNYITYNQETLGSIDLKNSQPYLLQAIFEPKPFRYLKVEEKIKEFNPKFNINNNEFQIISGGLIDAKSSLENVIVSVSGSQELTNFRSTTRQGTFYENVGKQFVKKQEDPTQLSNEYRKLAKKGTYQVLFAKNSAIHYSKEIRIFKNEFPLIYAFAHAIKKGKHNTLALVLQWVEAKMILGIICRKINEENPEIPLFTIHDSIVTTVPNLEKVEIYVKELFLEVFGDTPSLEKEIWKN